MRYILIIIISFLIASCKNENTSTTLSNYFTYPQNENIESAGVKMIPIKTPVGEFKVWRTSNDP